MVRAPTGSFVVDKAHWPFVRITGDSTPSVNEAERLVGELRVMFDSQARFCVLTDFSAVTRLELPVIRTIGTFARDNAQRIDAQVAALAVVAPSATVRGALRVLFSIKQPAHPYVVVADPDAALDYIETHLAELLRTDARSA